MKDIDSRIIIKNLTRRRIPRISSIKRTIKEVLRLERQKLEGLSVVYVNDARIRRLNLKYKKRNSPTDVLAFSMKEGRHLKGEKRLLGDIVISIDAAARQAKYYKTAKKNELKLYLIHGLLHLLGYDDKRRFGSKRIKKKEEELQKRL